ncbi:MAG: integrase [Fulvimarina manganoxydans]|uniref:integrase n=1 Tax=Fulvimarina manganoxydans TaxID=937218 RepID=UPI0023528BA0|nr:integrase [Fulvimarina manganoxydans]MCK5930987.1 integrase [Fulvimarina manganoxydans]
MEDSMSRDRRPARLWLEPERRKKDGKLKQRAVWIILDGDVRRSTGCGAGDRAGAEIRLREYLAERHAESEAIADKTAAETAIADVLRHYATEHGHAVARPTELGSRIVRLIEWWGDRTLDEINARTCRAYAAARGSDASARRELEDLRAAIRLYAADGLCREHVVVTLPAKSASRVDYLTRNQAAALIRYLYRAQAVQGGNATRKHHLRHLIPFVLVAIYTGTRSSRIWNASYAREPGRPWMDVDGGVFYRSAQGERVSPTKRAGSVRIPPRLLAHLRRYRDIAGKDYVVEYRGRPADPKKALARAMDHVYGADHPFVRHTFRHTAATWLMWSGEDLGDIAAYLSMTREVLMKVYGHEHPDADRDIGQAFNSRAGRRRKIG